MRLTHLLLMIVILSFLFTGCRINESYWIGNGEISRGSKDTINGNIHIGENSNVTGACRTINGSIDVGDFSHVRSLRTINGSIEIGRDAEVNGDVTVINGEIHCKPGVKVMGEVGNIKGEIKLEGTLVEDDLTTYTGDIKLYENTIISGDIIIKEAHGSSPDLNSLYIEITDDSVVEGDIINKDDDTEVTVYLSNGGKVKGRVEGAKMVQL